MTTLHTSGRKRELRRAGISLDMMITPDTYQWLLTKESLIQISNIISKKLNRRLNLGEIDALTKFIARLPESRFYQLTLAQTQIKIAVSFINANAAEDDTILPENDDYKISGIAADTDIGTISDYERKEIAQFTPDENQFKFTAFQDRRGNAVIDEKRVKKERSSPDNIASIGPENVNRELYNGMKMIQTFLDPSSIENMFLRTQSVNTNYFNINLPHQLIQFDSRNRLPVSYNPNTYKWNLHAATVPGQIGDIQIQDTLQQIIRMQIYPFWAPINATTINIYDKIRMLIIEYASQSVNVSEFNDPTLSIPTIENYHFELEVQQIQGDRMYLYPREPIFTFRKPMAKNIDTFTVQFRTPFLNEIFDADSGIFTITYQNPTLFTITNPTSFSLNTGDLVYVYNSDSGTNIDNEINRIGGQIITKLSNTQFTIAVDSSSLSGSESGVNVYFGSKRLFFQIEFVSLEQ